MPFYNCPNCFTEYSGENRPNKCEKCGFPFNGSNEKDKNYIRLFSLYNDRTTEELLEIINSGNDYTDEAKKVAQDILDSDRYKYNQNLSLKKQEEEHEKLIEQEKHENALTNPLYDDIHQIAGDLRFIKNFIVFNIVCYIITIVIVLLSML